MIHIKFSYKSHLSETGSEVRYAFTSGERMRNMLKCYRVNKIIKPSFP